MDRKVETFLGCILPNLTDSICYMLYVICYMLYVICYIYICDVHKYYRCIYIYICMYMHCCALLYELVLNAFFRGYDEGS